MTKAPGQSGPAGRLPPLVGRTTQLRVQSCIGGAEDDIDAVAQA